MGINAESYLLPGGIGIKLLEHTDQNLKALYSLPIVECDLSELDYFDYNFLNREKITSLILPSGSLTPFSSLADFNLSGLKIERAHSIDFENLSVHSLETLQLPGSKVKNLGFCREMPLKHLNISNTHIHDLAGLNSKQIIELNLFKTKVKDLGEINCEKLEVAIISATDIHSINCLSDSKKLKKLEARGTPISDLSPLADSNIEELYLPGSNVSSIDCLAYLPIKKLNIIGLKIEDLSCLSTLPLQYLSISPDIFCENDFDLLRNSQIPFLRGPADPENQTAEEFLEKYEKKLSSE